MSSFERGISALRGAPASLFAAVAIAAGMLSAPALAKKETVPVEYGPAPDWERYKELGEMAIRAMLVDPGSAVFVWNHGYARDGYTPLGLKRRYGYATCGWVNAKNRMGGYSGPSPFAIVINHDKIVHAELGKPGVSMLGEACKKAVVQGKFPLVSAMPRSKGSGGAVQALGFAVEPAEEGARVVQVIKGGAAEASGLIEGAILSHLNGIPLKGLRAETLNQIIAGTDGERRFTNSEGRSFLLNGSSAQANASAESGTPRN